MSSYPLRIDYMQPSSWSAAIAAFNDGLRRFVEGDRKRDGWDDCVSAVRGAFLDRIGEQRR